MEITQSQAGESVTQRRAALRQLCTAIRMFYADDDAISVHTLACASREIFEKHCTKEGLQRTFDIVKETNPGRTEKELWDILNGPRNFFKHPSASLTDAIYFSDAMNDFVLLAACLDYSRLFGPDEALEVESFKIWFMATHTPDSDPEEISNQSEFAESARIMGELDKRFPGLRSQPRKNQKQVGSSIMVGLALADKKKQN